MAYQLQTINGTIDGVSYKYTPYISINELLDNGTTRHVASINLISDSYGDFTKHNNKKMNEAQIMLDALNKV